MGPISAASRSHGRAGGRVLVRRHRALVALVLGAATGTGLAVASRLPESLLVEAGPRILPHDALAPMWTAMTLLIPGTEPVRWAALGLVFSVALGVATGWLGYQLFRGPGRVLAAFTSAFLSTSALGSWLQTAAPDQQFPALPFGVLALLAVTALVRPLVHLGRVTPVAFARALAAAGASAVVLPSGGLGLLLFCGVTYLVRGRRIQDLRGARPDASRSRASMSGRVSIIAAAGLAGPTLGALVVWSQHADPSAAWTWLRELRPIAPPLETLRHHVHPYLVYPALTLVALLVVPLRWRGGITLLGLFAAALTIADTTGPVATVPVLLCGIAVAASGWVWLAGSVAPRPAAGRAFALAAGLGLAWLAAPAISGISPAADTRPTISLRRAFTAAASSPGDVLLVHEPALVDELAVGLATEGARPDLHAVRAATLSPAQLQALLLRVRIEHRRVLSDAFDLAGRGDPEDAIEVGPWYWFAFDPTLAQAQRPVEIPESPPGLAAPERARWTRLQLERARFRRATGRDADAVLALSLGDERRSLRTAIRVSQAINLPARPGSELGRIGDLEAFDARVPMLAESGDLLFRAGEHELGLARLTEAARLGYPPAWRGLARWQLEAGRIEAAEEALDVMAGDLQLREATLDVIWWLIWKRRRNEALAWRDRLGVGGGDPAAELAMRLAVLTHAGSIAPSTEP